MGSGQMVLRLHNTATPLRVIRSVSQPEREFGLPKPRGLWYGVGDSWLRWCESEQLDWIHHYTYALTLAPGANILRLKSLADLTRFQNKYGFHHPGMFEDEKYTDIDWPRVAKDYDGIEIAPYIWRARFTMLWYYGWDVASGCIWNARAVKSFKRVAGNKKSRHSV
jgi:hypothetical protein